jgi:hypothetical protein
LSRHEQVLAALDVHTSKWIVDKCFAGDLVKDRTIILVVCACSNCNNAYSQALRRRTMLL